MHDDSLAAKNCVLDLPLCGRFFIIEKRRYPPNKKNVSLAGQFLCLNKPFSFSLQAYGFGGFFYVRSVFYELQATAVYQRSGVMKRTPIYILA